MPLPLAIPLFAVLLIALACAVYYGIVLARIRASSRAVPTVRAGLDLPEPVGGWPSVCVIIPAHNEADVIAASARALLAQDYPRLRVVYALDRCTDETAEALEEALRDDTGALDDRVEIMTIEHCPDDWAGKTNAIWRAVQDSAHAKDADALFFTDADTAFDPALVRAAVALLIERRVGMISLLSTLTFDEPFERRHQPAAGFELVRQFPLDQINNPGERTRNFANGQFMLFTRDAYEAVGGHEAVREDLLEDLAFAKLLSPRHTGKRVNTLLSDGMLLCRMYRSPEAFRKGWKRIFTEAVRRRPLRLRRAANRLVLTGVVFPLSAIVALLDGLLVSAVDPPLGFASIAVGSIALLLTILALRGVYRAQGAPARLMLTYPLGAMHVAGLLREAANDLEQGVQTEWGGRRYTRKVQS